MQHFKDRLSLLPKGPEAIIQLTTSNPPTAQETRTKSHYDKVCYFIPAQGESHKALVGAYKAADKLTPEVVMEGLRDMNIKLLEFRCHAQLKATPQFGMADIPSLNIVGRLCI